MLLQRFTNNPTLPRFLASDSPSGVPGKAPQVLGKWHCMVYLLGTGKSFLWNVCVCQTTKEKLRRETEKLSVWQPSGVCSRKTERCGSCLQYGPLKPQFLGPGRCFGYQSPHPQLSVLVYCMSGDFDTLLTNRTLYGKGARVSHSWLCHLRLSSILLDMVL